MSKPLATLSPLHHRGALHIKVEIESSNSSKALIRQVPGRQWSKTHGCWYVPYTPEAYRQLQELFQVKLTDQKAKPAAPEPQMPNPLPTIQPFESSVIENKPVDGFIRLEEENKHRMKAFVPWQRKDWIDKIKTIPGRAWNQEEKYWSLPMAKMVVDDLKKWFENNVEFRFEIPVSLPETYVPKNWKPESAVNKQVERQPITEPISAGIRAPAIPEPLPERKYSPAGNTLRPVFQTITNARGTYEVVTGNKIIVERWDEHWLCAYVPYDKKGWLEIVKSMQGRKWNSTEKCWLLPLVQQTVYDLNAIDKAFIVIPEIRPSGLPERWAATFQRSSKPPLGEMQQLAVTALEERLTLEYSSYRTIKSYRNHLEALLRYCPNEKPSKINLQQIEQYILYKRREKNISASTLNQLISALNAFFGRVLGQEEKVQQLQRPKKDRTLPNFASEDEIKQLIKAADNPKHQCMLILIYSAGLRKSELLNLRVRDLNKSAKCLFVKGGKGRKDRYSMYSPTAIRFVESYLKTYKVSYWLFEGQDGGKYSESSLQSVFEKTKVKSGINERLTIHGLRHSFATHLAYKGVPLHEIKSLLGHESIKTTEVYLHLSRRYNKEIESPLEGLDL